jgi:hypothetical protein
MSEHFAESMEDSERAADIASQWEATREELRRLSVEISGWDFDEQDSNAINIQAMAETLFRAITQRDERIGRLHMKLGQIVERSP